MEVKIKLFEGGVIPTKGTDLAAEYDLYAPEDMVIPTGRSVIKLKFAIQLPEGYKAEIQSRSGYSSKGFEGVSLRGVEQRFGVSGILHNWRSVRPPRCNRIHQSLRTLLQSPRYEDAGSRKEKLTSYDSSVLYRRLPGGHQSGGFSVNGF